MYANRHHSSDRENIQLVHNYHRYVLNDKKSATQHELHTKSRCMPQHNTKPYEYRERDRDQTNITTHAKQVAECVEATVPSHHHRPTTKQSSHRFGCCGKGRRRSTYAIWRWRGLLPFPFTTRGRGGGGGGAWQGFGSISHCAVRVAWGLGKRGALPQCLPGIVRAAQNRRGLAGRKPLRRGVAPSRSWGGFCRRSRNGVATTLALPNDPHSQAERGGVPMSGMAEVV